MTLHWGTFHNCRTDEDGERVADVRALCGATDATSYVFRPEQITCDACRNRRDALLAEADEMHVQSFRREYFCEPTGEERS